MLRPREHAFLDTRKSRFWRKHHIYMFIGLGKWKIFFLRFIFLSISFDFMMLVDMLTVEKEHLRLCFVLPWGLASPLMIVSSGIEGRSSVFFAVLYIRGLASPQGRKKQSRRCSSSTVNISTKTI